MHYQHLTDYCFEDRLGEGGLKKTETAAALAKLQEKFAALKARKVAPAAAIIDLAARTDDLGGIEALAADIRGRFRHVVVAGSGGSGLSGRTLTGLRLGMTVPSFHYLENIDPDGMDAVLSQLDVRHSCYLIISRSGETAETLSQFYVLRDHVAAKAGKEAVAGRFFVITLEGDNSLRRSAGEDGMRLLPHDPGIGGRFCVLTNVGLLPAAIAGLDIRGLRRGALSVIEQLDNAAAPGACWPAIGAAIQYAFLQRGRTVSVTLPYGERLVEFSRWVRQCWAESLGKQGRGSTPVPAQGSTDQRSQLQLYLDGPKDKLFHMITLKRAGTGARIHPPERPELAYLQGKTLGDVMAAEQKATFETLVRRHCPVRLFSLDSLAEEQMGALLMHMMLEIILMSFLLEVNAFDQPAVETGKKLARDYLLKGDV